VSETNSVVAIYDTHTQAEEAVKELQRSGFDMRKMSIVGKDYHTDEHVVGYYNTGDRMKYWGKLGAFWGGLWGMLFGAAFFPKDSVVKYEAALKSDKFLLLAHGTADEVAKARDILQTTHAMEVAVHAPQRGQLAGSSR
jgi:hypothetical protein